MAEEPRRVRTFAAVIGTGASISGVGVGMLLMHWHPVIGVVLIVIGALYLLWELFTCGPVVKKVPEVMLRLLGAIMLAAFTLLMAGPDIQRTMQSANSTASADSASRGSAVVIGGAKSGPANGGTTKQKSPERANIPLKRVAVEQHVTPAPPVPDVQELLTSGKLSQGWTLHKRDDVWTIYCIINTDLLDAATKQAIEVTDLPVPSEILPRVKVLWKELSARVPQPTPVENAYGPLTNQTFVQHICHWWARTPQTLKWNYEVFRNGSAITPPTVQDRDIVIADLSSEGRDTVAALDSLTLKTVNRRFIDATVKVAK